MDIKERKKALRKEMMDKIRSLDTAYTVKADRAIVAGLLSLDAYQRANTVFCFVGSEHEINTAPFLQQVLDDGKRLAVPLCTGKGIMEARNITSLEELEKGYYGLLEPSAQTPLILPEQIDLAVIPCVSCGHTGSRLGHGGGFYDIYFSANPKIQTVMICREKVMREDIPREPHDLIFPVVLSEDGLFTSDI